MDPSRSLLILFAGLGAILVAGVGAVIWVAVHAAAEDPSAVAVAALGYAAVAGAVVLAAVAAGWALLQRRLTRPIEAMTREGRLAAHSRTEGQVKVPTAHWLGLLPEAIDDVLKALSLARRDVGRAMAAATAEVDEQKRRLEAILRELTEGVLVCNAGHEVLLYNEAALRLLGAPEALGLGRSLFDLVTREPILHALQSLEFRLGRPGVAPEDLTATLVCATTAAPRLFSGRMRLVLDESGAATGYVLTLVDVSRQTALLARREETLGRAMNEIRQPTANLRAAAETLRAHPGMSAQERASFEDILVKESGVLSVRLDRLAREWEEHIAPDWPMADIYASDLLSCIIERLRGSGLSVIPVGIPLWLHGESHGLVLLLEFLVRRVSREIGVKAFDLEPLLGDRRVYLDLRWQGPEVPARVLEAWLDEALEGAVGGGRARDVVERHGGEIWCQRRPGRGAVLRVPVPAPHRPQFQPAAERLPPRPEFYDFDLLRPAPGWERLRDRPLAALPFVIFDTETTGLRPSEGDEIVSLAAVRVVNGRILTGETFERLVNPGRRIPKASIRFHGITDDMVKDKPPLQVVLPQFKRFVGDAVLVAHNAAFDLKFLRLKESECGVRLENPVLDTLLLSMFLHDTETTHDLDTLAERYGVEVADRHTALGDAFLAAAVFVRELELLEARGMATLGKVLEASNMAARLREMQEHF